MNRNMMELKELIIYVIHYALYIPIIKMFTIKTTISYTKIQQNIKARMSTYLLTNSCYKKQSDLGSQDLT